MPLALSEVHRWKKGRRPFGLSVEDAGIFFDWDPDKIKDAIDIWTTVPVGNPKWTGDKDMEFLRKSWIRANQKKIDVVIETPGSFWIIELRNQAGTEVIGTLKGYEMLFKETYPTEKKLKLMLITNFEYSATRRLAMAEKIDMISTHGPIVG